jgi:hypothetical protein
VTILLTKSLPKRSRRRALLTCSHLKIMIKERSLFRKWTRKAQNPSIRVAFLEKRFIRAFNHNSSIQDITIPNQMAAAFLLLQCRVIQLLIYKEIYTAKSSRKTKSEVSLAASMALIYKPAPQTPHSHHNSTLTNTQVQLKCLISIIIHRIINQT